MEYLVEGEKTKKVFVVFFICSCLYLLFSNGVVIDLASTVINKSEILNNYLLCRMKKIVKKGC